MNWWPLRKGAEVPEKLYARYYKADGTYLDHGRLIGIGGKAPKPGQVIQPFHGTNGPVSWTVVEVKKQDDPTDPCIEIYVEAP